MTDNPSATYADQLGETGDVDGLPDDTAPIQLGLADVNGDGLPDRVFTTPSGVFARYNLGYRFAAAPVKLSTGGFESQESYAGGLSLGFSTPWPTSPAASRSNWNVDLSRYAWVDVNGDGILDQVHKIDNSHPPTVRFGTGSGMLPPVTYGQMADAQITDQIDAGQQASLDRTTGLGGQFDFTVGIGPLCLVACYLIINPGASYQNSVSSTEVDLEDVNGDGYADSLQTLDDNSLQVRENKQADTNLLATVQNPLGGTITMTYERDGNTVDSPASVVGHGVGGRRRRPARRRRRRAPHQVHLRRAARPTVCTATSLGYATVTETEIDTAANPPDGAARNGARVPQRQHLRGRAGDEHHGQRRRQRRLHQGRRGRRGRCIDVRNAAADLNALDTRWLHSGYSARAAGSPRWSPRCGDGTPGRGR